MTGAGVDDRKIALQSDLDVMGLEIADRQGNRGLLEERGAVDQRLVGVATIEILGEDFVGERLTSEFCTEAT